LAHLLGEDHFTLKSLIFNNKLEFMTANSRIQDRAKHS
jgi:hypothetical protein